MSTSRGDPPEVGRPKSNVSPVRNPVGASDRNVATRYVTQRTAPSPSDGNLFGVIRDQVAIVDRAGVHPGE